MCREGIPPLHIIERACNAGNKWKSFCWRGRAQNKPNSLKSSLTHTLSALCPTQRLAAVSILMGMWAPLMLSMWLLLCHVGSTSDRTRSAESLACIRTLHLLYLFRSRELWVLSDQDNGDFPALRRWLGFYSIPTAPKWYSGVPSS